jgi:hypothetical protein
MFTDNTHCYLTQIANRYDIIEHENAVFNYSLHLDLYSIDRKTIKSIFQGIITKKYKY